MSAETGADLEALCCVAWVIEATGEKGFQDRGIAFEEARERADKLNARTPQLRGMRHYFPCSDDTATRVLSEGEK